MPPAAFEFTLQFGAGAGIGTVDPSTGVLRGVTVAEVGDAIGHFAFVDAAGKVVGIGSLDDAKDFPAAKRRLPLAMDEISLDTVVAASLRAKRVKTREDHDDSIQSRAGFSESFRREGTKVVCDLNLLDAYINRAVFLETAQKTPELIGLSGDFKFTAEVNGDRALMRVTRVDAVDIVDKGALTHAGLFAVRRVDSGSNSKSATFMAKKTDGDGNDGDQMPDLDAFKTMCDAIASYRAKHADAGKAIDDAMSAIKPVPTPTPKDAPAPAKPDNTMTAADTAKMKAELTSELTVALAAETAKAVTAGLVEFRKEMSALGLKPAAVPTPSPTVTTDPAKATTSTTETFLSLKAKVAGEKKISASAAGQLVMREKPELYAAHLREKGIISEREYSAQLAARK